MIYVSTATVPMTAPAFEALLMQSRAYNRRVGITGYLLYQDGFFLQMLEGKPEVVAELMNTLRADSRHRDVRTVIEGPTKRRIFVDWSMGSRDLAPVPDEPEFDAWPGRTISFLELAEDARMCYRYMTAAMHGDAVR